MVVPHSPPWGLNLGTPNYWETGVDSEQLDARSSATEKDWILACELTACSRWIVQGFHLNEQVMPFLEKENVEPVKLSSNVSNVMNLGLFPEWQPTIFGLFAPIFGGSCCPNCFGYWCAAHWHKPLPPSGRDVALERLNRGQDRCPSVSQQTSINRRLFLLCLCSWWFLWVLCSY